MQWYFISSFIVIGYCLQQYCMAQTTTVRPYKFGFTIEEQQHRYEKRDERGIVMGEFGFITADGIYHVTVYATDEQGRFRILAMKNYPYESPPKSVEVLVKPKMTITTTQKPVLAKHNFNTEACSGCFLKNGKEKPKGLSEDEKKNNKFDIRTLSQELPESADVKPKLSSVTKGTQPTLPIANKRPQSSPGIPTSTSTTPTGNFPAIMDVIMNEILPTLVANKGIKPATTTSNAKPNITPSSKVTGNSKPFIPAFDTNSKNGNSNPKTINGDGDLYRFKYILDYHGHTETGKRNGNKEGNYFAIGDDNVERTIEYVANENGYQPHIRWRKLNQQESKPKENTLKDYEFVWFTQ